MSQRAIFRSAALIVLVAWLLLTTALTPLGNGTAHLVLSVPASYVSVGQEFQPQLMDATGAPAQGDFRLELLDDNGRVLWQRPWSPTGTTEAVSLPRTGVYQLRALPSDAPDSGFGAASVTVNAMTEPSSLFGGVRSIAAVGLDQGFVSYLQSHGFAVSAFQDAETAPVVVVGDPLLGGGSMAELAHQYRQLWDAAADGARVLLLEPPPPGVATLWPLQLPLAAAPADCGADLFEPPLTNGLQTAVPLATLLHPALAFDVAADTAVDLYRWDGSRLQRPNPRSGYDGCHPLFDYRYGDGWITVSTLPLLEHFQDTRARLYLMNLLKAMSGRMHPAPSSPGLKWVTDQRLAKPGAASTDIEAFYTPPPAAIEPAEVMAAAATDGNPKSCFSPPGAARAGMGMVFVLPDARAGTNFTLDLGGDPQEWPTAFTLEASGDGIHWQAITPTPAISPEGRIALQSGTAAWREVRLLLSGEGGGLRVCEFMPQAGSPGRP